MAGDLFKDLPPPTGAHPQQNLQSSSNSTNVEDLQPPPGESLPPTTPALKSSLKRSKLEAAGDAVVPEKRTRFKTTTDASEKQLIEAMQKISSHIKNPTKFSKASKLAIQLIQAGSVMGTTTNHFFAILEAAMLSPTTCNEHSFRADYYALFSAAQEVAACLSKKQQTVFSVWTIRAVWANDLFTDDSFVFSKTTGKIKEAISALPVANEDDDKEEASALEDEIANASADAQVDKEFLPSMRSCSPSWGEHGPVRSNALMSNDSLKEEELEGKKASFCGRNNKEVNREFLKIQREALISCLELAAKRYKTPWCQTTIDILAKHAFDNVSRFTTCQRDAIEKLWASIREQQNRRKQGKSVSGKLDVSAFEWLQEKYATEKISIRHAVGGGGDRRCEQWLG